MGLYNAFEISAAGMNVERMRLDASALNLANAHTTQGPHGLPYKPLKVIAAQADPNVFNTALAAARGEFQRLMPSAVTVTAADRPARMVYEPGHPAADDKGFVTYPGIEPVAEMVALVSINRAYEANVRAMNIAKSMALKALDIGGNR